MAGSKQPIELVIAKGKKHLTKAEIAERRATEIQPITDGIQAPSYLNKKQAAEFDILASQLVKLKIMGETDVDALARYVQANNMYQIVSKKLTSKLLNSDPIQFDNLSRMQERYFKMLRGSAADLGLTISSRCKLVVPQVDTEQTKTNKFDKFKK